jgi:hypothetical protein
VSWRRLFHSRRFFFAVIPPHRGACPACPERSRGKQLSRLCRRSGDCGTGDRKIGPKTLRLAGQFWGSKRKRCGIISSLSYSHSPPFERFHVRSPFGSRVCSLCSGSLSPNLLASPVRLHGERGCHAPLSRPGPFGTPSSRGAPLPLGPGRIRETHRRSAPPAPKLTPLLRHR